jgi:hypothetical protein
LFPLFKGTFGPLCCWCSSLACCCSLFVFSKWYSLPLLFLKSSLWNYKQQAKTSNQNMNLFIIIIFTFYLIIFEVFYF